MEKQAELQYAICCGGDGDYVVEFDEDKGVLSIGWSPFGISFENGLAPLMFDSENEALSTQRKVEALNEEIGGGAEEFKVIPILIDETGVGIEINGI
ncbi:hypothetical protein RY280_23395 [Bacillus paralicheniformis]|uniref:hypothetical protein n=1 Tax=Bacillus paralicheniformis TaxID=1648923 RepID=UPI00203B7FF2|nr:hypothetical protein [Bacillus paralicheniformis]MCM3425539.1 hypothetical protein [Bacillus paralicheniformis]